MRNRVITFFTCNVTLSDVMASSAYLEHMLLGDFMYIFCQVWTGFNLFIFCTKMLPSLHPNLKASTWITAEIAVTCGAHTWWRPPGDDCLHCGPSSFSGLGNSFLFSWLITFSTEAHACFGSSLSTMAAATKEKSRKSCENSWTLLGINQNHFKWGQLCNNY